MIVGAASGAAVGGLVGAASGSEAGYSIDALDYRTPEARAPIVLVAMALVYGVRPPVEAATEPAEALRYE